MKRTCLLGFTLATTFAAADIHYRVELRPDTNVLHVTMRIPDTKKGAILQIPNWAPGAYMLRDSFKQVQNLKAIDEKGKDLEIKQDITTVRRFFTLPTKQDVALNEVCTWSVAPALSTTIDYDIPARFTGAVTHWSGPSTYMYEVNRKDEKCLLTVHAPKDWQVYNGLDETRTRFTYAAPDYDTLADNPVTAGTDLLVDTYTADGKPHFIVMRGQPKGQVDRAKLIKACKFVTDMQLDFFGGHAPYDRYVWHFDVNGAPDGAGGLEHLSSTQITLAAGVGPRAVSVLSHEFFHLWNVKRIRSRILGPFDYTKLPSTGALWWLEGVTDYYASYLLYRYGWTNEKDFLSEINSHIQGTRRNNAFSTISANESSLRMPEMSNGRGNSNGYLISYYELGWLAGMCLDLNLRSASGGQSNLDNVTRSLWAMCRDGQPGFSENAIRNQFVAFGGTANAYDRIVNQPSMPIDDSLTLGGLMSAPIQIPFTDIGFSWSPPGQGVTALVIAEAHGPAEGKLAPQDTLVSVNGKDIKGEGRMALARTMQEVATSAKIGEALKVVVLRDGKTLQFDITPVEGMRQGFAVTRNASAPDAAKRVGDAWLKQR